MNYIEHNRDIHQWRMRQLARQDQMDQVLILSRAKDQPKMKPEEMAPGSKTIVSLISDEVEALNYQTGQMMGTPEREGVGMILQDTITTANNIIVMARRYMMVNKIPIDPDVERELNHGVFVRDLSRSKALTQDCEPKKITHQTSMFNSNLPHAIGACANGVIVEGGEEEEDISHNHSCDLVDFSEAVEGEVVYQHAASCNKRLFAHVRDLTCNCGAADSQAVQDAIDGVEIGLPPTNKKAILEMGYDSKLGKFTLLRDGTLIKASENQAALAQYLREELAKNDRIDNKLVTTNREEISKLMKPGASVGQPLGLPYIPAIEEQVNEEL